MDLTLNSRAASSRNKYLYSTDEYYTKAYYPSDNEDSSQYVPQSSKRHFSSLNYDPDYTASNTKQRKKATSKKASKCNWTPEEVSFFHYSSHSIG